jgi:hypothetical protein
LNDIAGKRTEKTEQNATGAGEAYEPSSTESDEDAKEKVDSLYFLKFDLLYYFRNLFLS